MNFDIIMQIVGSVIFVLIFGAFFLTLGIYVARKFDL